MKILEALFREKGITGKYGVFSHVGEGTTLPDGDEDCSGMVIDEQGRVFSYWTGWSDAEQRQVFIDWEQHPIEDHWTNNAEYQRARVAAGLV